MAGVEKITCICTNILIIFAKPMERRESSIFSKIAKGIFMSALLCLEQGQVRIYSQAGGGGYFTQPLSRNHVSLTRLFI
jgi:hypothetical protein